MTWGNGVFVAVASSGTGTRVQSSADGGVTWTLRISAADNQWYGVTFGAGLFVAMAQDGFPNQVQTSDNGTTWTSQSSAANNNWMAVTYGGGTLVSVAQNGTINNQIMTSRALRRRTIPGRRGKRTGMHRLYSILSSLLA